MAISELSIHHAEAEVVHVGSTVLKDLAKIAKVAAPAIALVAVGYVIWSAFRPGRGKNK